MHVAEGIFMICTGRKRNIRLNRLALRAGIQEPAQLRDLTALLRGGGFVAGLVSVQLLEHAHHRLEIAPAM
jgi:hypothetical protein